MNLNNVECTGIEESRENKKCQGIYLSHWNEKSEGLCGCNVSVECRGVFSGIGLKRSIGVVDSAFCSRCTSIYLCSYCTGCRSVETSIFADNIKGRTGFYIFKTKVSEERFYEVSNMILPEDEICEYEYNYIINLPEFDEKSFLKISKEVMPEMAEWYEKLNGK